jgi:ribosomal protein S2
MMEQEYNGLYVTLRNRIRKMRARLLLSGMLTNSSTIEVLKHLDEIAKHLDERYADRLSLDDVEINVSALESGRTMA